MSTPVAKGGKGKKKKGKLAKSSSGSPAAAASSSSNKTRQLLLDPSAWSEDDKSLTNCLAGLEDDIVSQPQLQQSQQSHSMLHQPPLSTIRTLRPYSTQQPSQQPVEQPPPASHRSASSTASAPVVESPSTAPIPSASLAAPTPQLFVEGKRRFTAKSGVERALEDKKRINDELPIKTGNGAPEVTTSGASPRSDVDSSSSSATTPRSVALIQVALTAQRLFLHLAHFAHGILAGFAFWQCVVLLFLHAIEEANEADNLLYSSSSSSFSSSSSSSLSSPSQSLPLSTITGKISTGGVRFVFGPYSALCKPANCVFIFLSTVTLVAALDDADIAASSPFVTAPSWICSRFVSFKSVLRAFVLPLLLLSFITNNVIIQSDFRIR